MPERRPTAASTHLKQSGNRSAHDDLTAVLRTHARAKDLVPYVGDGWLALVRACHEAVVAEFPNYELLAVKQKYGELAFQAFPTPHGQRAWRDDESRRLDDIVEQFREQSTGICEACGRTGEARTIDRYELILCEACTAALSL